MTATLIVLVAIGGFALGYFVRKWRGPSKEEVAAQLSKLDSQQLAMLVGKLESSWGISAMARPAPIARRDSENDQKA